MNPVPTWTLRPLDERDLPLLLDLYRRCEDFLGLGPQAQATPEMVLADLALSRKQGGVFSGIFIGESLAGVLDVLPDSPQGPPDETYLELLMIAADQRGLGLGAGVMQDLTARLRALGKRALSAHVQINNPDGLRFWERQGFRVVSEPQLQPDGTTTVKLFKIL